MGKKMPKVYDKKAMHEFAFQLSHIRQPVKEGSIPTLQIDVKKLEEAVRLLPKKDRESLEVFWGLIPGTVNHGKKLYSRDAKDVAFENMRKANLEAIRALLSVEYLKMFDSEVEKIYKKVLTKINKNGVQGVSDIDAVKRLMLYKVFIEGGPKFFFEEIDTKIEAIKEPLFYFDDYMLLKTIWEETCMFLPDNSINLKLLIETITMFDCRDIHKMMSFVRIGRHAEEEDKSPRSFKEIREFKEMIFKYASWDITTKFVYGTKISQEDVEALENLFEKIRQNYKSIEELNPEDVKTLTTSQGSRNVIYYSVGTQRFSDISEILSLFINRKFL